MTMKTVLASALTALFLSSTAFAQTAPATTTAPKAPPAPTAPATPAAPKAAAPAAPVATPAVVTPKAAAAQGQMVNLNTATETELEKLDQIGPARAKSIVEARTKGGKFKNWDDFVARNVVPKNAEEVIKGKVSF